MLVIGTVVTTALSVWAGMIEPDKMWKNFPWLPALIVVSGLDVVGGAVMIGVGIQPRSTFASASPGVACDSNAYLRMSF
ncbi:MAG: hypothetical protein U0271_05200 [Polyangiaceae bacterium]